MSNFDQTMKHKPVSLSPGRWQYCIDRYGVSPPMSPQLRCLFAASDQDSPDRMAGRDQWIACLDFEEKDLNVEGKLTK